MKISVILSGLLCSAAVAAADIELPKPETSGGMPLMEALQNRRTERKFSEKPLPLPTLSNLLWAANGISREDGRRTAPTAMNRQEITLYVMIPEGTFRYDAAANRLVQLSEKRAGDAPLMVLFVADTAKQQLRFAQVDSGFIGQNIYLFCASEKLATVFRASFREADYNALLKLPKGQQMLYVQAVGYPAANE